MSKDLKDRLARLHYYSQNYDDLLGAALGSDLLRKLRDELSGASFRQLEEGVSALFFRGKELGDANGHARGLRVKRDELFEEVRAEVVADIVCRLDRNNDE